MLWCLWVSLCAVAVVLGGGCGVSSAAVLNDIRPFHSSPSPPVLPPSPSSLHCPPSPPPSPPSPPPSPPPLFPSRPSPRPSSRCCAYTLCTHSQLERVTPLVGEAEAEEGRCGRKDGEEEGGKLMCGHARGCVFPFSTPCLCPLLSCPPGLFILHRSRGITAGRG